MKFGYFTLTDNPPAYGASRRDPNQFLLEVVEECVDYLKRRFDVHVESRTVREEHVSFPLPRELRVLAVSGRN